MLGKTPTKTVNPRRRLVYSTPQNPTRATADPAPSAFWTPAQQIQSSDNTDNAERPTMTTRPGIMVTHITDEQSEYSGMKGVIISATPGPSSTTLNVLWTSNGVTAPVEPDKLIIIKSPETTSTPAQLRSPFTSSNASSRGYTRLLPEKLPSDLICPLTSVDPEEVEDYQRRMTYFLCSGHPKIKRLLLKGPLEHPLMTHQPYLKYMDKKMHPKEFEFDYTKVDEHIETMRQDAEHLLALECERLLDNPPAYDGWRPCNNAVFNAMLKSLRKEDNYILQQLTFGDGIGLRNLMWEAMNDDAIKSKKLMAMTHVKTIHDIKYKFERFGVKKYFAKIHKTLAKLKSLGATKQDWEVFSAVFDHMSKQ